MGGGGDPINDGGVEEASTVNIQCSNGSKFTVQVKLESTVETLKSIAAEKCDIPPSQQRLIYKGRILKDDQTLHSYGLEADHTVHLVRGFATAAPADTTATTEAAAPRTNEGAPLGLGLGLNGLGSGGGGNLFGVELPELAQMQQQLAQNPNMMSDMLNMPLVQNLMNNPETIRNLIMDNPQMREIMDRNPELAHVLNDPNTLRQTMEAARNPELMREMMRNTDRAMSNIESSPEGFNMLRRMYENVQEPFLNATTMTGDNGSDLGSNPLAGLLGAQGGRENLNNSRTPGADPATNSPVPNTNPLPNPWAPAGTGGRQTNSGGRVNPIGGVRPTLPAGTGGLGLPDFEGMLGDLSSINQLMQNPAISQMMGNLLSSPQYMNQILGLNPQLRGMLDANPQLRDMIQNPEFVRQLTSPETMQQLLNFPQGLSSQPGLQQTSPQPGQNTGATAATPNNFGMEMLMNMFGGLGTGGGFTTPNSSQVPPEELFATQLSQLQEMGFFDTQENIRALLATAGNVNAAVERLLGNPGQ